MPMSAYSKVQTGPNTQLGGRSGGLLRVAYHVGILGMVASDPMAPAAKLTISEPAVMRILRSMPIVYAHLSAAYNE